MTFEDLARGAYRTFCKEMGQNGPDAAARDQFDALEPAQQQAWIAVARQVVAECAVFGAPS